MKFNGIDPRTLAPGISIEKEIPPGAPASELETIAGSEGEIVAGRTIKQAEYTVRINVASRTRAGAWEIREKLAAWARATDTVTHELIPTHRPDRAYDAIFKDITAPEFSFGFGVITVVFAIPRPITHDMIIQLTTQKDWDGSGTVMVVNSGGSSYIRPLIEINAKETERIELSVDDTVCMAIDRSFVLGDLLTVQTDPPAVWVTTAEDGKQPAEKYLDYTVTDLEMLCHKLQPGLHTISSAQANKITATWRDEYL